MPDGDSEEPGQVMFLRQLQASYEGTLNALLLDVRSGCMSPRSSPGKSTCNIISNVHLNMVTHIELHKPEDVLQCWPHMSQLWPKLWAFAVLHAVPKANLAWGMCSKDSDTLP